jgi:hypothetical protein
LLSNVDYPYKKVPVLVDSNMQILMPSNLLMSFFLFIASSQHPFPLWVG